MVEAEIQSPQESLRTFDFRDFRSEKLASLAKWEAIEFKANYWVFRHRKFDRGKKDCFFEVYKFPYQTGRKENRNRVNLIITTPTKIVRRKFLMFDTFQLGQLMWVEQKNPRRSDFRGFTKVHLR